MRAIIFSSGISSLKIKKRFSIVLFSFFFILNSNGEFKNDTLLIVHDRDISKEEFLYHFQKNNQGTNQQNIEEFLESFINFQLKLAEARETNGHRNLGFIQELAEYRLVLSGSYLTDTNKLRELAKEAYERLRFEVSASYILVQLDHEAGPKDTLLAYNTAIKIRNRILDGKAFEQIDLTSKDDLKLIRSSGNFDYFTAFQTEYSFESTVYNMKPGEISIPVRSSQGYHIIQLKDKRRILGELKAAHIMIDFVRYNEDEAKDKIMYINDLIKSGSNFEELVLEYSTDSSTVSSGGVLPWYECKSSSSEIGITAESLKNLGDVSEPIRTHYGWHIIKLLDSRDLAPFEEMEAEIETLITEAADERLQMIEDSFTERLELEWDFKENPGALEIIYKHADEKVFKGNWLAPSDISFDETLFLIDGIEVNQRSFIHFMNGYEYNGIQISIKEYIYSLYQEFVSERLKVYENYMLEEKYPVFSYQFNEYRDAMLLLMVTKQEVWQKSESDSEGMRIFFENNRDKYVLPERLSASIFSAANKQTAKLGAKMVSKILRNEDEDVSQVLSHINDDNDGDLISLKKNNFSKGENILIDQIKWKKGVSKIISLEGKYHFVFVDEVLLAQKLSMEEAIDAVRNDYQDYLMSNWIESLRSKYEVHINETVLKSIQ